jgi:hypothetical protein
VCSGARCPRELTRYPSERAATISRQNAGITLHHPSPDQVSVPERRLVDPRGARVHEVVLDPKRARGALAGHDPGGDRDEPGVTDQADDLPGAIGFAYQLLHRIRTAELVRRPSPRDHDGVDVVGGDRIHPDVGDRLQAVLAADRRSRVGAHDRDHGAFLPQPHHRDPELEVLEPLGEQDRDLPSPKPFLHRHHHPSSIGARRWRRSLAGRLDRRPAPGTRLAPPPSPRG